MQGAALLLNETLQAYRMPRLRLLANGRTLIGASEMEVTATNHFSADRFEASVAIVSGSWDDAVFWSSETDILIDIQIYLDNGTDYVSLIQGFVDGVSINPIDNIIHISGRDFTAALIEAQTQEAFSNRTSSEIAKIFAQRHGLTACVVTTSTPVGRFYQSDHEALTLDRFSQATTEWDFLVYLARQENYDVFVAGNSLNFRPISEISTIDRILCPRDMTELRLERSLTLARDIQVVVQSWNSLQQLSFSESITGSIIGDPQGGQNSMVSQSQRYVLTRPNMTPDKALALAQQRLFELARHERVIEFSMPGELVLTPRSTIRLDGTGTDFDQAYYIDSIERRFGPQTGFVQRVRAANSSPRSESVLSSATQ
jgi:hypothetical protein